MFVTVVSPGFHAEMFGLPNGARMKRALAPSHAMPLGLERSESLAKATLGVLPVIAKMRSFPGCVISPLSLKRTPVSVM